MFLILWEFEVKPGGEKRFERVYGPEGDWATFFRSDPAYRGTRLVRDVSRSRAYLTLDSWTSRPSYEAFRQNKRTEYDKLDAACESLTEAEALLGTFTSDA